MSKIKPEKYIGQTRMMKCGMKATVIAAAFVFHDKTHFYVTYTENDSEILDVMCIDDMKQKLPLLTNPNNPEI